MNKKFRVGIVGLLQESNTFIPGRTHLRHFREDMLLVGPAIRDKMISAPHEVGGFFDTLEKLGIEPVPVFLARALPYGVISESAFSALLEMLLTELRNRGPYDGILAAPHGATVAENHPDADGFWLSEVRRVVGPSVPIIATIDLHANVSSRMIESTDAMIAYGTNPHLDQRDTGKKAARLISRTLSGEIRPTQRAVFPPMAINIQSHNTNERPLSALYTEAAGLAEGAVSYSLVPGFPYADVPEMGSSAIVVTDNDPESADRIVSQIGQRMMTRRHEFEPTFVSIKTAADRVRESSSYPVVALDMGDNVGGGSPGDSTAVSRVFREKGIGPLFVCLFDPEAARTAHSAGPGTALHSFHVGDTRDPHVEDFRIISLHDGIFRESETRHGGFSEFDQGLTAVLSSLDSHLTVMATSRRVPPFSLRQLTAFGVDPHAFKVVVAKGVIAPIAAYELVAKGGFVHVDSPGVTRADMTKLEYRNRRRPMYPFEDDEGLRQETRISPH